MYGVRRDISQDCLLVSAELLARSLQPKVPVHLSNFTALQLTTTTLSNVYWTVQHCNS